MNLSLNELIFVKDSLILNPVLALTLTFTLALEISRSRALKGQLKKFQESLVGMVAVEQDYHPHGVHAALLARGGHQTNTAALIAYSPW